MFQYYFIFNTELHSSRGFNLRRLAAWGCTPAACEGRQQKMADANAHSRWPSPNLPFLFHTYISQCAFLRRAFALPRCARSPLSPSLRSVAFIVSLAALVTCIQKNRRNTERETESLFLITVKYNIIHSYNKIFFKGRKQWNYACIILLITEVLF